MREIHVLIRGLFTQGCLLRKHFSLVLVVLRRPSFPGSLPTLRPSSDTSCQLDTCGLCWHTSSQTHTQHKQSLKPTVKTTRFKVLSAMFTLSLYNQPSGAFYTLLFFTVLLQVEHTDTRSFAGNTVPTFTLLVAPLRNTCIHTVFFAGRLLPSGFPWRCWVWHPHPASLGAPRPPPASVTPCPCWIPSKHPPNHHHPHPQVLHVSQSV